MSHFFLILILEKNRLDRFVNREKKNSGFKGIVNDNHSKLREPHFHPMSTCWEKKFFVKDFWE